MKLKPILLTVFLSAACLLAGPAARAQDSYASGFGLDSKADSAFLAAINKRMDSIRVHRPTVALVLSGGGAKGAAHVGALEYIETLGIPVDMVIGTSIGGLVGGLYSIGYTPKEMDSLLTAIDWSLALSDRVKREYIPYAKLKYKEKYALSFPFYYSKSEYSERRSADMLFSRDGAKLHLAAGSGDASHLVKSNLLGSLPSGYIRGQNVGNLISSLTVGYQDSTDFINFPIPFVCVATDLVSGRAKVWHSGRLATAMRSTMSIPGLFAPVRTEGMVLVDGGMRNNFPADLAAQMGADLIIGVDLSDAVKDYPDIHNIGDIVWQSIDMMGNDSFRRNLRITDLKIKPDLHEYDMMSFDREAVDTIMDRGYAAAVAKREELEIIRDWTGTDSLSKKRAPAVNIARQPVRIDRVEITGVSDEESKYLMKRLGVKANQWIDADGINAAVGSIFGTKSFDSVSYELLGESQPYKLKLNCLKGPIHKLGLGIRVDSEDLVAILLNVGLNTNSLSGSALDFETKIGVNPYASLHYTYDAPSIPTVNVTGKVRWIDRNEFIYRADRFNLAFLESREEVYLSNIKWYNLDIKGGLRNETFNIKRVLAAYLPGEYSSWLSTRDYASVFLDARGETFDKGYFPTKGYSGGFSAAWTKRLGHSERGFLTVTSDGKVVGTMGSRFAMIPSYNIRFIFGDEIPFPYANVIGGVMPSRYFGQQLSFIGINNAAFMQNCLIVARTDFRYMLFSNNYITATVNYSRDFDSFSEFNSGRSVWGCGLEYAYDSIIGPIRADVSWSTLTRSPAFYVSLGFDF